MNLPIISWYSGGTSGADAVALETPKDVQRWWARTDGAGTGGWRAWLLPAALVSVAAAMRLVGPGAFPEIEADEGLWTNSSKNFVVFGDWFMDGRTHMLLSPLFHSLSVLLFRALGPGIATARLLSGAAGALSVLLLYVLVLRTSGRRDVALVAAVLFGINQWTTVLSRRALIEAVELCAILGAAVLVAGRGRWSAAAAGAVTALALLAKVNAAFFLGVLGLYMLLPAAGAEDGLRRRIGRTLVFGVIAVVLAAAAYGALYRLYPDRFVAAFVFELDGEHFEGLSDPVIRVGRFGLDPEQASRTILALVRESPFLLVLAFLGAAVWLVLRPRGAALYALWLGIGGSYLLGQMFQPLRYFYLVAPAFAYFGALAIVRLANGLADRRSRLVGAIALAVYCGFETAYLGANALANRGTMLDAVVGWVLENTRPDARIMAAGYFCTDLPRRAYAHYLYSSDAAHLLSSIGELEIDYVIVDDAEWPRELREAVAARFERVHSWTFGAVYRARQAEPAAVDAAPAGTSALPPPPG